MGGSSNDEAVFAATDLCRGGSRGPKIAAEGKQTGPDKLQTASTRIHEVGGNDEFREQALTADVVRPPSGQAQGYGGLRGNKSGLIAPEQDALKEPAAAGSMWAGRGERGLVNRSNSGADCNAKTTIRKPIYRFPPPKQSKVSAQNRWGQQKWTGGRLRHWLLF